MKKKHISMSTIFRLLLTGSLLFAIILAVITQLIAKSALINRAAETSHSLLSVFVRDVDIQTLDVENYVFQTLSSNRDLERIQISKDEYDIVAAKQSISSLFQQFLSMYPIASGITLIQPEQEDVMHISNSYQVNNYSDVLEINRSAEELIRQDAYETSQWFSVSIQRMDNLLMRIVPFGSFYCCVWITMDSINESLEAYDLGEDSIALLCSEEGQVLNYDGFHEPISFEEKRQDHYVQINQPMSIGDFRIVGLVPEQSITSELNIIHIILLILSLTLLLVFPVTFILVKRAIYNPFTSLIAAMDEAAKGDLYSHIDTDVRLTEFQTINKFFNHMIEEIRDVKIEAYEHKLKEQKIKRHFLQSQIKSHFYLNCINIIYMLAQNRDHESIEMLSMNLVRYFRYMAANSDGLAPLGKEIAHVENYIEIQKFRYPDKIDCRITVSGIDADPPVPALMLQTFVENSIKYCQRNDVIARIDIAVDIDSEECRILIRDNGNGFPEDILESLSNEGEDINMKSLEGIGIKNVKSRLELLYQGQARIAFENDKGAVIHIRIPYSRGGADEL